MRGVGPVLMLLLSLTGTLWVLDRTVSWLDLGYHPARGRPSDDRVLVSREFAVHVHTNALGFRERRLPGPKPAGTSRIVVVGDSFTQGYGVSEEEAFPRQLEAL